MVQVGQTTVQDNTAKRMGWALVITLIYVSCTVGQPRTMMREDPEEPPPFFFFEPVNLVVAHDSSLSRLDIHYRIDQTFFVAIKNRDSSSSSAFVSRGEVLVELFDSTDVSKARSIQRIELATNQALREPEGKEWHRGMASFEVPPGRYKIVIELDDFESERRFIDDRTTITLKRFPVPSRETSTPLFVEWKLGQTTTDTLVPVGFGPNLLFGRPAAIYVELPSVTDATSQLHAEYTLSAPSVFNHSTIVTVAETLKSLYCVSRVKLTNTTNGGVPAYTLSSDESSQALGVIIPLASGRLPLRRYNLDLTICIDSADFRAKKQFQMVWPDMPFSLREIDVAINALRYITTSNQRDSLLRGNLEERRDKLETFWKRKDTSPETAYNEVMVEYYRRVDYASKTFGTLREPDGFKSDRGRIYILHGPPTKTERILNPSAGYQEVWLYEKTGKKFIFADQTKSGNYVLISTEQL